MLPMSKYQTKQYAEAEIKSSLEILVSLKRALDLFGPLGMPFEGEDVSDFRDKSGSLLN